MVCSILALRDFKPVENFHEQLQCAPVVAQPKLSSSNLGDKRGVRTGFTREVDSQMPVMVVCRAFQPD